MALLDQKQISYYYLSDSKNTGSLCPGFTPEMAH